MAAGTVARNFVWVTLSRVADTLGTLVLIAVVARYLGVEEFGEFSFYMAMAWTLSLFLTLGIPKILVRELAKDRGRAAEMTGAAMAVVLLSSAALFALVAAASLGGAGRAGAILAVILAALSAMTLTRILSSVYWAHERMQYELYINLAVSTAYLALTVAAVALDRGVIAVYASFLAANLLGLGLALAVSIRAFGVVPRLALPRDTLRYLAREAAPMLVAQGLFQAYLYSGVFALKWVGTGYDLGIFQAPTRIVTRLQVIPLNMVVALAPLLSRLAVADIARLREIERTLVKLLVTASIPLTFAGVIFAPAIVRLFFGEAFLDSAVVLQLQLCALVLFFVNTNLEALLVALQRQRSLNVIFGAGLAASVAVNLLLVPSMGYLGASVAVVVSQALMLAVGLAKSADVFSAREALRALWRPAAAAAAAVALVAVLPWRNGPLLLGSALALFGALMVVLGGVTAGEIATMRGLLRRGPRPQPPARGAHALGAAGAGGAQGEDG